MIEWPCSSAGDRPSGWPLGECQLIVRNLLVTAFCLVLLSVAIRVTRVVHSQLGVAIEMPLSLIFASLPVTLVLMAWWSLRLALRERRAPAPE
jgi:TRAP-type C4-dicarboxylate transport system permease small subunit